MSKRPQFTKTIYCIKEDGGKGEMFLVAYEDVGDMTDRGGELVGIYDLREVQKLNVTPALAELVQKRKTK